MIHHPPSVLRFSAAIAFLWLLWAVIVGQPVGATNLNIGTTGSAISAGGVHTVALNSDATVYTWGKNVSGQLGDGGTTSSSTPVVVTGLTDVIAVEAGSDHTVALSTRGASTLTVSLATGTRVIKAVL